MCFQLLPSQFSDEDSPTCSQSDKKGSDCLCTRSREGVVLRARGERAAMTERKADKVY